MARADIGVDGECFDKMELPMIIGGSADLNGSQKGKFHGMMTVHKNKENHDKQTVCNKSFQSLALTKSRPKRLVGDSTSLVRVDHVKLFILQESLRVINIILQLDDALVYLGLRLDDGLTHFLSHEASIGLLVLCEYLLKAGKFFKAFLNLSQPLRVHFFEALMGAINCAIKLPATHHIK